MNAITISYETLVWFEYQEDPIEILDFLNKSIKLHLSKFERIQIKSLRFSEYRGLKDE